MMLSFFHPDRVELDTVLYKEMTGKWCIANDGNLKIEVVWEIEFKANPTIKRVKYWGWFERDELGIEYLYNAVKSTRYIDEYYIVEIQECNNEQN